LKWRERWGTYLTGKRYKEEKKHGGDRKTEESSGNNCHLKTEQKIADTSNVSHKTVRNAEKFADVVDKV